MEEQQQQEEEMEMVPHCVKNTVNQKRKSFFHSNVVLALPAMSPFPPGAAVKKRAPTNKNTTGGGPSNISNGANNEHRYPVREDEIGIIQQENSSNIGDDIMEGRSGDASEPNIVSNEQYIAKEEAGSVDISNGANNKYPIQENQTGRQHNFSTTGDDIMEDHSGDANEHNIVSNEQYIPEEEAVVENQQNIAVNQQYLLDEQAGIMQEQNIQNAIEENAPEDPAVFGDIFNFPLKNELVDLSNIEDILEDPIGVQNEPNIMNNQQHIPVQQAGIVQQQNLAENAVQENVAEDDPTVFGDIFDFPLNNQLMDLD